jgi:hypothetical protein
MFSLYSQMKEKVKRLRDLEMGLFKFEWGHRPTIIPKTCTFLQIIGVCFKHGLLEVVAASWPHKFVLIRNLGLIDTP